MSIEQTRIAERIEALRSEAIDLQATIARLTRELGEARAGNYKAFTDGMEAAAQICGSLAETTYDDADAFEAATGCEGAIMRVVNEKRAEQTRHEHRKD